MPSIITQISKSDVSFELERENISWDLVISENEFIEKAKNQKDSILLNAENISENFKGKYQNNRRTISGPRKIRISIINKENNKNL